MLGNIINVKIHFDKSYIGVYDGRTYVVHTGIATDNIEAGNSKDTLMKGVAVDSAPRKYVTERRENRLNQRFPNTLHNVLVFNADGPLSDACVRVKVMAVAELGGKIVYICADDSLMLYDPIIREVLAETHDLSHARITCLYEKSCGAVIFRRHSGNVEYLLIKNKKGNNWGFPKGHMEIHENERQTAVREVKEETGLNVELLDGFRTISEYHPKGRITKQVIFFVAEMPSENVVIQKSEVERFIWADYSLAVKTFKFNNDKKVLAQAKSWITDHLY